MNIADIRQKYPMYSDISDGELVRGLHSKFYSDIPYADFLKKIDFSESVNPASGMSTSEQLAAGSGKAIVDTGRGIGQLFGAVPQEQIDDSRALDAPLMETTAGKVGNIGTNIGLALAPGGALKGAAAVSKALNAEKIAAGLEAAGSALIAPKSYAGAATQGAALSGVQPVATGESRAVNTAIGAGAGAGGRLLFGSGAAAKVPFNKPLNPELQKEAKVLGYELTPGQIGKSRVIKNVEEAFKTLPGSAGQFARTTEKNQELSNSLVANEMGEGLSTKKFTDDVFDAARSRISGSFDRLSRDTSVKLNLDYIKDVNGVLNEYQTLLPEAKQNPVIGHLLNEVIEQPLAAWRAGEEASMTGKSYQALRSSLVSAKQKAFNSGDANSGQAWKSIIKALDDAATKSMSPADRQAWDTARSQWRVLRTAMKVTENGDVNTVKLGALLKGKNELDYMSGRSADLLTKVGKIGQAFKTTVPNSGTAERLAYIQAIAKSPLGALGGAGVLGGGGYAYGQATGQNPLETAGEAVAIPYLASKAYLSRPIVPMMQNGRTANALRALTVTGGAGYAASQKGR